MSSVYQPRGRNILRLEIRVRGEKKPVKSIPLTPELKKDYQWLRNLIREMERAAKSGTHLSDKSQEAVRKLRRTNPELVQEMTEEGWFVPVSDLTLEEAFNEHIDQKRRYGKSKGTIKNWINSTKRIYLKIDPLTPVSQITLKQVEIAFGELKQHEDRWGKKYSVATLEKDAKNLRELFRTLLAHKDITENPIGDGNFKFKIERWERPKPAPTVPEDVFRVVLDKAFLVPKELQQKTLLAYYRLMSSRQNDPRLDYWEDVDLKKKCVNRYNIKEKAKQGLFPANEFMWNLLMQWRDEVIAKHGKAEGPIFPWIYESTSSNQYSWFKRRIKRVVGEDNVWTKLLQALRASRSREIRRMDNGRFLESEIVGHSPEVADKHYDNLDEAQDFEQIWNEDKWKTDNEGEAA